MECQNCGTMNQPGALLCESCSDPLEVNAVTKVGQSTVVPTPASTPAPVVSSNGLELVCCLVENGQVNSDKKFEIPEDDFEFSIGRTDLDEGIIPDVDLTKFGEKVVRGGKTGYTFSRKQAVMSRRVSRLFLKAIGSAKTMVVKKGGDWKALGQDEEVELNIGDRFRFGGSEGSVIFEVA